MESFYKKDVAEKCHRASYMTMLNIQIVGEEQVLISLLCYVYLNLVYVTQSDLLAQSNFKKLLVF